MGSRSQSRDGRFVQEKTKIRLGDGIRLVDKTPLIILLKPMETQRQTGKAPEKTRKLTLMNLVAKHLTTGTSTSNIPVSLAQVIIVGMGQHSKSSPGVNTRESGLGIMVILGPKLGRGPSIITSTSVTLDPIRPCKIGI